MLKVRGGGGGGEITTNTDSNSTSDVIPVLYTVGF